MKLYYNLNFNRTFENNLKHLFPNFYQYWHNLHVAIATQKPIMQCSLKAAAVRAHIRFKVRAQKKKFG